MTSRRLLGPAVFAPALLVAFVLPQVAADEEPAARPVVVERIESRMILENSGRVTTTFEMRVHVLSEEGRQYFGQLYFPFQEGHSEVRIEYVRTIKPGGEVVETAADAAPEVTPPELAHLPRFTDFKYRVVPVAGLQVGDTIHYRAVTTVNEPLSPGQFWQHYVPMRTMEVRSEHVVLDLPADREVALRIDEDLPHETEERDGRRILTWELTNPKPVDGQAATRRLFSVSTFADWAAVGRWIGGLFAEQAVLTPELRQLAETATAGLDTPRLKLEAIFNRVSTEVRYVQISLGIGGLQPHSAAQTWNNQYGDCKDKHTVLAVLLQAVGLQARPVLVRTSSPIEEAVPSPGEFDHVVTLVRIGDESIWLDATSGVMPPGWLPSPLRGRKALYVDGADSRLVDVPEEMPFPDSIRTTLSGRVDVNGTLQGRIELELRGIWELPWRFSTRMTPADKLPEILKLAVSTPLWNAELEDSRTSDPLDLAQPFRLESAVKQSGFLELLEPQSRRSIPAAGLDMILLPLRFAMHAKPETDPGEGPLELGGPLVVEDRVTLTLGPNFEATLPEPVAEASELGSYTATYAAEAGTVTITRRLEIKPRQLDPGRRDELRALLQAVDRDHDRELSIRRLVQPELPTATDAVDVETLMLAGAAAAAKGDVEQAHSIFEAVTTREPEHPQAWVDLGVASAALGRLEDAERAFARQLEIDPEEERVHLSRALLFMQQGRTDDAVKELRRQIEVAPEFPNVYRLLLDLLRQGERWDEIVALLSDVAEKPAPDATLLVALGDAELRLGRKDAAAAHFERAVELSGQPGIYNDIAYALAEANHDLERARSYAESAVVRVEAELRLRDSLKGWPRATLLQRQWAAFLDTLGWVLARQGELERAAELHESALKLAGSWECARHLADVRARQQRFEDALGWYARAVHLGGSVPPALPEALRPYVDQRFGEDPDALERWVEERRVDFAASMKLEPREGTLTWPSTEPLRETLHVEIVALVDERGTVLEAEALSGESPWREAALADVKRLPFSVISKERPIRTLRIVSFSYPPSKQVLARESQPQEVMKVAAQHGLPLHEMTGQGLPLP